MNYTTKSYFCKPNCVIDIRGKTVLRSYSQCKTIIGGINMYLLLVMCLGILAGRWLFPEKYRKLNERLQMVCTIVLIFCMGVTLGSRENFLEELKSLGVESLIFFFIPTALSIALVFLATRRLMGASSSSGEVKK